jgi:polysaccharide pyruvyl transferase WcaK-like protein
LARFVQYFIYGYYGYGNFGDDLLLRGMIEGIHSRDTNASFFVHSFDAVPGYKENVQFTGLARQLQNVRSRPWRLIVYIVRFARWLNRSDVMVIGGGTLFIDKGRINASLALLYLAVCWAAIRGKRVVVVGVGIDDLTHPVSRWLTHRILTKAEFVAVRESMSLPYVSHRSQETTRLSADMALGLDLVPAISAAPRLRQTIGFCFIDYFGTVEPSAAGSAGYEVAIIAFLDRYRSRYDLICITFQRGIGQRDDWLWPMLQKRFPDVATAHIDSLDAAQALAKCVDILVTTRFHLGVLGVMWSKPVLVVDHERKMASLAADFALPVISLQDFASGSPIDLDAMLAQYDLRETRARLAASRQRVALNFEWVNPQASRGTSLR